MPVITLSYEPQPRQKLLHTTDARWALYGGAAGGGKSHAIRWDLYAWCLQVPGIDCYLFRRTLGELEDNHIRKIRHEIPPQLATYNETRKRLEFENGSGINFCYCEKEKDVERYQGAEIHVLGIDEAGHLTPHQLNYLVTRVRLGAFAERVPAGYRAKLPRAVLGSNPGGPGHAFLKRTFIEPAPAETIFHASAYADPGNPEDRGPPAIYIPARMQDNRFLDKGYAGQFGGLAPELARALREGDWDAVVGAAIHNISRERHLLRPFVPPRHWTRFMSIDWGTAKPFSVGWYAVSEGAVLNGRDSYPSRYLPAGAVVRYAEWYGWNGREDEGCRLASQQVAREILRREAERGDPPIDYRVADSQMWAQHDGPSVQENMFEATDGRLILRKAKKDRKANYTEVISRLAGNPRFFENGVTEDEPMLFATANCTHFWRTVPILTLDETDPEKGPDTKLEDHVYDELAYACRSRPFVLTEQDRFEIEFGEEMREARGEVVDPYSTRR